MELMSGTCLEMGNGLQLNYCFLGDLLTLESLKNWLSSGQYLSQKMADQQLLEAETPSQVLVLSGITQAAFLTFSNGFSLIRSCMTIVYEVLHDPAGTVFCADMCFHFSHFLCSPGYAETEMEGGTRRGKINLSRATIRSLLARRIRHPQLIQPICLNCWKHNAPIWEISKWALFLFHRDEL